jgi:hypothetical protein
MTHDLEQLRKVAEAADFEMPAETIEELGALQKYKLEFQPKTVRALLSVIDAKDAELSQLRADMARMKEALEAISTFREIPYHPLATVTAIKERAIATLAALAKPTTQGGEKWALKK